MHNLLSRPTIARRFVFLGGLIFSLVLALAVGGRVSLDLLREKASLAEGLESEGVHIEKLIRGLTEFVITEGTPASAGIGREGIRRFDETYARLLPQVSDPALLASMKKIAPRWSRLKAESEAFLNESRVSTADDAQMIRFGRLSTEADALVRELQSIARQQRERLDRESVLLLTGLDFCVAMVAVGVIVLLASIYRSLARPIIEVAGAAQRMAAGDYDARIAMERADEIGTLVSSFNSMARHVQEMLTSLSAAKHKLDTVIRDMTDGVIVVAANETVVLTNPALHAMLGDIIPETRLDAALSSEVAAAVVECIRAGREHVSHADIKLGSRVLRMTASPILVAPDEGPGVVAVLRDITHEWEVDRMKTEFIATVSHELRTPLTSVLGFSKTILRRLGKDLGPYLRREGAPGDPAHAAALAAEAKIVEHMNIILFEAQRLTDLINDVLDIAKMEAGKMEWRFAPVDLGEVIRHAFASTQALFEAKGLEARSEVEETLPMAHADRNRLIQVLTNLISNAVKFTEAGTITCRARQEGSGLRIDVSDTGSGIDLADQGRIFEKFKQVGDTLTDKPQGTGLGLPICRQIVEHHGGRIWVTSRKGQGSTFSFTLPAEAASQLDLDRLLACLREHTAQAGTPPRRIHSILVVDDDPHIRALLHHALGAEGYRVDEAADGLSALAAIQRAKPDLVLLDVILPDMNGFDVAAVLKNGPATQDLPIIIVSVMDEPARGYRLGVEKYLTKPLEVDTLLQAVGDLTQEAAPRKKSVLLVDQAAGTRQVREMLEGEGFLVVGAADCGAAFEQAKALKPDVVVLDSDSSTHRQLAARLRQESELGSVFVCLYGNRTEATTHA